VENRMKPFFEARYSRILEETDRAGADGFFMFSIESANRPGIHGLQSHRRSVNSA